MDLADAFPGCPNLGQERAIELLSFTQIVNACDDMDIDAIPLPVSVPSAAVCSAVSTIQFLWKLGSLHVPSKDLPFSPFYTTFSYLRDV